ncbi:MAG: glutathione S-transferase family protein [Porticoccaceae bacterium]|nr:glutathione S-transferase family protein [Porticoccaceae bacterium]
MGLLQRGKWVDQWYDTDSSGGEFKRQDSRFRHWITAQGEDNRFIAESDRYHLFVSLACPWAHRTLIFRVLKQLQTHIGVTVVKPLMLENGWEFCSGGDDLYGLDFLYELYLKANPNYEGRVTVPLLWDKKQQCIVNNESADIIRIFNSAFNQITGNRDDYYPEPLRKDIDAINQRVYDTINNGVYRAGFATSQSAYEKAYTALFASLDWVDDLLSQQPYLVGGKLTEADWRLFTTLIRFDAVYHGHFKCNRNKLAEYRHIPGYMERLYGMPGVAETVNFDHIKQHYYGSHKTINPFGIIPAGPKPDFGPFARQ